MPYKYIIYIILISLVLLTTGCTSNNSDHIQGDNKPPLEDNDHLDKKDPIQEKLEEMTLEEKIGQMIIIGLEGYDVDDHTKEMIEENFIGGVILFSNNIKNPQQLLQLTNNLKEKNKNNRLPLFISIDEEGGRVSRLPSEFVKFPSNGIIGGKNNPELSYEIGSTIAKQIQALGFNIDFAPVLDIHSNPNNSVIGDRSFGSDKDKVGKLGIETMKGIQSQNIISVVKHFPGHGDTDLDSHSGLPSVDKDIDELMELELFPFKEAIENKADAVMVAHILYNEIDSQYPATLSESIMQEILRKQLGFKGLIFTDDMTMGAIVENYDIGKAAVQSIKAGSDIVLVCHGYENEDKVVKALKEAVKNGDISENRINESLYRIIQIKGDYKLTDEKVKPISVDNINKDVDAILDKLLD